MNSDTGEIGKFNSEEEAKAAGYGIPLTLKEFNEINCAPKAKNVHVLSKMIPGRKLSKSMSIRRAAISIFKDKFKNFKHSHSLENTRRRLQITRGFLSSENGLVLS